MVDFELVLVRRKSRRSGLYILLLSGRVRRRFWEAVIFGRW